MKKLILVVSAFFVLCVNKTSAQNNSLGADDEFMELLMQLKVLRVSDAVGSYEMLQNLSAKIDDKLAHKFLLQNSEYTKVEASECYPIGFVLNKENNIAIVFYYRGPESSIAFFVNAKTFNYKTGKLIDDLNFVGGFSKEAGACNVRVQSSSWIEVRTIAGLDDKTIDLKINNKGKFDRK
jgi:hypothetical protein